MMTTSRKTMLVALALGGATIAPAYAQQEHGLEQLEITMTLLPENATNAADVMHRVELPSPGADNGYNGSPPTDLPGLEHGLGQGLDIAAEARERGQDIAAEARDNRENASRGDDPPGPPDELPGPPTDLPGPPENLPGAPDNLPEPPVTPGKP